ncbi:MAG TPA: hypothetical protein DCR14_17705 [Acidimicrobiaceae bacterium]|nr:hypothetical protein [Acidimicrobiaceae bacterium]
MLDVAHLFPVKVGHDADFAERVAAVVHQRSSLFEAIASVGQVSRLRAPFNKVVAARLAEGRAALRDQLAGLFARELRAFPAAVRAQRLAAADVLAGFEGWHLLRTDQGLTVADAEAVLADSLARLLEG